MSKPKNLIALANPESVSELTRLALMSKTTPDEPVHVLAVVNPEWDPASQIKSAEELIGLAEKEAGRRDEKIESAILEDINVAHGMIRAIRKFRICDLFIGWNRRNLTSQRIFGTVLDQLLTQTRQNLMVAHFQNLPDSPERMFLIVPPMVQNEPGFPHLYEKMFSFARHSGAEMILLLEYDQLRAVRKVLRNSGLSLPGTYQPLVIWDDVLDVLEGQLKEGDIIFLTGARRGSASWNSAIDEMPRLITERFEKNSLVIGYPRIVNLEYESYFDPDL